MPKKYGILVCSKLRSEFKAALMKINREDVVLESFDKACGHNGGNNHQKRNHAFQHLKTKVDHAKIIGPAVCLGKCEDPKQCQVWNDHTCLEYFIPQALLDQLVSQGSYITTPGWLMTWRRTVISDWGFDAPLAQAFFSDFANKIVLLDTKVLDDTEVQLEEFSKYVSLPTETLEVGTSYLELKLDNHLKEWEHGVDRHASQLAAQKQQIKLANLSMIYDLIPKLASSESEQMVLEKTMEIIKILFAPQELIGYRFESGEGSFIGSRSSKEKEADFLMEIFKMNNLEVVTFPEGFIYAIQHEEKSLAYFGLFNLEFPEHIPDYVETLSLISSFLGLFMAKARQRDKMLELQAELITQEEELASYNVQLESVNTELQEGNVSLELAMKKANEAIQTKDKFFSILAHDLRSPFNGMLGFSELLKEEYDTLSAEEHKEFIEIIHKGITSTYILLNDLLSWSRAQRGVMPFNPKIYSLGECVNEGLKSLEQTAHKKQISFILNFDKSVSVYADEHMLRTIIRNLISNALKFSYEEGKIEITGSETEQYTTLKISDQGVGITEEQVANLFDVAKNTSTEGTNGEPGTGLGLILCSEFCEKHCGTMEVNSLKGSGSTFTVYFPQKGAPN